MIAIWTLLVVPCLLVLANDVKYRLPQTLIPTMYSLEITTNLGENDSFTFQGVVRIEMQCRESTTKITLHSKDLMISEVDVTLTDHTNTGHKINGQYYVPEHDFYVVYTEPLLKEYNYTLSIPFAGKLTEGMSGYYRSSYEDRATRHTRWLSVTQFEPTDARRAFPCFDEPSMKAKFNVSLGRLEAYNTISNMPLLKTQPITDKPGWYWDHYETSAYMSTYLLAFIVSDFKHHVSKTNSKGKVMFRIWSRRDAISQTQFASEVGPKFLEYYEQYFGVDYPLPKQDMIAIPDFNSGAMENWGLITYRETALLYHPTISSLANKHSVASVIAHELAHQWFGNLVTMKWWTDLWLNEGFATYVATLGVEHVHPEMQTLNTEVVESFLTVFTFDALLSSHPVSIVIGSPSEINQIFDTISYKKGCNGGDLKISRLFPTGGLLLRMMNLFLSEPVFRKGVTTYLKTHKFSNAEQDDLWLSMNLEAHESNILQQNLTIKTIMDSWTLQTGYPVVTVTRDYEKGTAVVKQRRYLSFTPATLNTTTKAAVDAQCWTVPLSYTTENEPDFNNTMPKAWLDCSQEEAVITGLASEKTWIIFNIKLSGLYRVQYDIPNWKLLFKTLNSSNYFIIDTLNRVQLINDAMDLAWIGKLDYDVAFQSLDYLRHETEYLPWRIALFKFNTFHRLLKRTPGFASYRLYVIRLMQPIYNKFKSNIITPAKTHSLEKVKQHRLLMAWACRMQFGNCVEQSRALFHKWMKTYHPDQNNPIHRDMRSLIYCYAIKYGTLSEWEFAYERYLKANVGTEKVSLLSALGCSRDTWLLNKYLGWTLDSVYGIRRQDTGIVFASVARNDIGYLIAKEFFMTRIEELHTFFGPKAALKITSFMTILADQMYTTQEETEFHKFAATYQTILTLSAMGLRQATESIQVNIQWHKLHYDKLVSLLSKYGQQLTES